MSSELKILKLFCQDKAEFLKGEPYLSGLRNMDREIKVVLNLIVKFYKEYEDRASISVDDLKGMYDLTYPHSKEKAVYFEIINSIFYLDVSTDLLRDLLEQIIERHYASNIILKLAPVVEGTAKNILPVVAEDINQYLSILRNPPAKARAVSPSVYSVRELVDREISDKGLEWFLPKLNQVLGGLKRGTLGVIFAYVDTGKTSFGMAACSKFCSQLQEGETGVYAGNEEAAPRLALRLTQAFLSSTRREVESNPDDAETRRMGLGFNKLRLYDSITHVRQLETIIQTSVPRFVFVDQGTKLTTDQGGANEVAEAQALFNWYREMAKLYDTSIVCLAQAVGDAENRKYLKLSDIYGSRVGIQGELDYAIGIGRTMDDLAYTNVRFINIPKNKLNEGETARFNAEFIRERCTFKEI